MIFLITINEQKQQSTILLITIYDCMMRIKFCYLHAINECDFLILPLYTHICNVFIVVIIIVSCLIQIKWKKNHFLIGPH